MICKNMCLAAVTSDNQNLGIYLNFDCKKSAVSCQSAPKKPWGYCRRYPLPLVVNKLRRSRRKFPGDYPWMGNLVNDFSTRVRLSTIGSREWMEAEGGNKSRAMDIKGGRNTDAQLLIVTSPTPAPTSSLAE
uniref:Uncharacterized protein n=1 Tax=Timema douglasi TaxID=61478 RepID=A0A7R8Z9N4_TIMDO|nr:unnamed protein product [Timema douglasi]